MLELVRPDGRWLSCVVSKAGQNDLWSLLRNAVMRCVLWFGFVCRSVCVERETEALAMPDRDLSQSLASTGSSSSTDRVVGRSTDRPSACFRQQQPKFSKVTFQTTLQCSSVSVSPRTVFRNVK